MAFFHNVITLSLIEV